jgi:hypothetical protein
MDELVVFELSCGRCATKFHIWEHDYRGQGYCSEGCRDLEQASQHRLANAKHQRSDEGRRDHADHQRASAARRCAEGKALTDVSRQEVASRAQCLPPQDPIPLAASGPEADGRMDAVAESARLPCDRRPACTGATGATERDRSQPVGRGAIATKNSEVPERRRTPAVRRAPCSGRAPCEPSLRSFPC